MAPKIAPDQGLAVMPQVLPAHLPKYPMAPPMPAPAMIPMAYLAIKISDMVLRYVSFGEQTVYLFC